MNFLSFFSIPLDSVLLTIGDGCPLLEDIEFKGAFLVTDIGFTYLLKSHPKIKRFLVDNSPQLYLSTIQALNGLEFLTSLSLVNCSLLDDKGFFLSFFQTRKNSKLNKINNLALFSLCPKRLNELSFSDCSLITDQGILKLIEEKIIHSEITSLDLSGCPLLTNLILQQISLVGKKIQVFFSF